MKKRYFLLILLLAALTGLVNWWQTDEGTPRQASQRESSLYPDAYAEQLTVTSYDAQGLPRHRLQTPLMRHFNDDTARLEQPRLWQYEASGPPWTVSSEKALLREDEETILLEGEVFIDRTATAQAAPYHIATRDLTVDTNTAYAQTSRPVRIENGEEWITAVGMEGWLREPVRIKLQQNVRAYYEKL